MIPPDEIKRIKEQVDLRVLAEGFTELRGQREKFGSCPRCGGRDRFHVQKDMFFCRQCLPAVGSFGRHDVFDFLVFIGKASNFKEAVEILSSWTGAAAAPTAASVIKLPDKKTYFDADWQKLADIKAKVATSLLLSSKGTVGQLYLHKRAITMETAEVCKLGLVSVPDAKGSYSWAISIPWYQGDFITAIQYRIIEPREQRYTRFSYKGYFGETVLYLPPLKGSEKLVIVEGEINALSIWQTSFCDVVSIGSQNISQKTVKALRSLAERYKHIYVWCDEKNAVDGILALLEGKGEGIQSKEDANDMLQNGSLANFIA